MHNLNQDTKLRQESVAVAGAGCKPRTARQGQATARLCWGLRSGGGVGPRPASTPESTRGRDRWELPFPRSDRRVRSPPPSPATLFPPRLGA